MPSPAPRMTLTLLAVLVLGAACARPPSSARPLPPTAAPAPAPAGYEETGLASWYGQTHHGRRTASGEIYDMTQMTAAHRTLPFGTWIAVESRVDGRTVEVRVTDRGPFRNDRVVDLSYAAARSIGLVGPGTLPVRLRVLRMPGRLPPDTAEPAAPPGGAPPRVP